MSCFSLVSFDGGIYYFGRINIHRYTGTKHLFGKYCPNYTRIPSSTSGIPPSHHCVKSVQIRSFFWSVFSCIRTEYGDLWSDKFIKKWLRSSDLVHCPVALVISSRLSYKQPLNISWDKTIQKFMIPSRNIRRKF